MPGDPASPQTWPEELLTEVTEAAHTFFREHLPGSWAPAYLSSRGFSPAVQQHWQAGYAPASWDALTRHLHGRRYPAALLQAAGLTRRSSRGTLIDTFRDRAVLPIRTADGQLAAFTGRTSHHAAPSAPRYLNSPRTPLYDKSTILFGLWEARAALAAGATPVLAEGPLDAIAITTASPGQHAGLAPCGTALTPAQSRALSHAASLNGTGILIAFDPDPAGKRAAVRAYYLLTPLTTRTRYMSLPSGHDPASVLQEGGPAALAAALTTGTKPLADLVTDTELANWDRWLSYPTGQASALRATAAVIAAMPLAHVPRQAARLAGRLGLDHATVAQALISALPAALDQQLRHDSNSPGRTSRQ